MKPKGFYIPFVQAANLVEDLDHWEKIANEQTRINDYTDEEVEAAMQGHPRWDNPPKGWTKKKLLIWSRGYLKGEATQYGNVVSALKAYLGRKRIKEIREAGKALT